MVATRPRSHKEEVLRKSRQLDQRYLHHDYKEEGEALGELRQSLQLYKRYLEHLGEEGNETVGPHELLPAPTCPAPPEGNPLGEGVQDALLRNSHQLYQRYLEHHEGEGKEALRELRHFLQLYNRYLERLEKEGNEALGRHGTLASGPLPVPAPPASSEGALRGEGTLDVFLEDIPLEQVVVKVTEISQGSKSHSFSPTDLSQGSSSPGYSPSGQGTRISRPYRFHHDHGTARVLVRHQEEMVIILRLS